MSDKSLRPKADFIAFRAALLNNLRQLPDKKQGRLRRLAGRGLAETELAATRGAHNDVLAVYWSVEPARTPRFWRDLAFFTATHYFLTPETFEIVTVGQLLAVQRSPPRDRLAPAVQRLIAASERDIYSLLSIEVRRLASQQRPINWYILTDDLRGWGHPTRYVQAAWLRAYQAASVQANAQ